MVFIRTVLCMFALAALAACTIVSDTRLIPLSESVFPLPKRLAVVPTGDSGKHSLTIIARKGRSYILPVPKDGGGETPTPVTFFKGPARSGFMIVEVEDVGQGKSGFHYALARVEKDTLALFTIDNADQLAIFGEVSGGRFAQELKVRTRANLEGAVSAMLADPQTLMTEIGVLKVFDLDRPDGLARAERYLAEQARLAR